MIGAKQLEKTTRSRSLKVGAVLPPIGLARFGLLPTQQLPRNVFVPLTTMQKLLGVPEKVNAFFVLGAVDRPSAEVESALRWLPVGPVDFGISSEPILSAGVEQISSDSLVMSDAVVQAAYKSLPGRVLQPVVTYLANSISVGAPGHERKIPYSTITGVDSLPEVGPLLDADGKPIVLADDEIVLNDWAADDLHAKVGDSITVKFYDPESTHGKLHEHEPPAVFNLRRL